MCHPCVVYVCCTHFKHVSSMCHQCVIHVSSMCHPCVIHVSSMCCVCVLYTFHPCVINVSSMCHPCVIHVSSMCCVCVLYTFHPCVTHVSCMGVAHMACMCHPCAMYVCCTHGMHVSSTCRMCVLPTCHACIIHMSCARVAHISSICHLCVISVSSMCHPCVIHVSSMCHPCVIHVSSMCHPCVMHVSHVMCHPCVIHVSSMCHPCVIHVSSMCHPCAVYVCCIHFIDLSSLNASKPTTLINIPVKILVETNDICSHFISKFFNDAVVNSTFPATLKMAEITPAHKKDETTLKENYRPISILPPVSKIFERTMYDHIYEYMGTKLSHYLCGFRKGYSTQYCLIAMLEQWKKACDKHNIAGALLTDLSKAFDCLNHVLLIAKLEAYGFDNAALAFISSYLSGRKQRTKVKNHFSQWSDILSGIPQGSILGPLLFNIYMNDIFYFVNEKFFANYAEDNTPYAIDKDIEEVLNILKKDTTTLIEWFNYNYFKMNADKCKLLITNHNENASISIQGEIISASNCVKLLGINIDNKLDYKEHISSICKKASLKLHALARISHFVNEHKLRILMKAFIESQFGNCSLIWMFHSRTSNNKINKLHERALRLVYKDYNSSFQELLNRDDSFSIHHRSLQKLATEMYKVKNDLSPSFMKMIFPLSNNTYLLRNDKEFKTNNFRTVSYGSETITYRGPKTWELVPTNIKSSNSLNEFKEKIKHWKPEGCMCRICKTYINNLGFI